MTIKFLVFSFILTFALPASAAWGVNERSVTKWSEEKLCESQGKYEARKDWKAVAIIAKEIANRPQIDAGYCEKLGEKELVKRTIATKNNLTGTVTAPKERSFQRAIDETYRKYGIEVFTEGRASTCELREFDANLLEKIRSYGVSELRRTNFYQYSYFVSNAIASQITGMKQGLALAAQANPNFCTASYLQQYEKHIDYLLGQITGDDFTRQNLKGSFRVGDTRLKIEEKLGLPIYSEKIDAIEEVHYCSTGEIGKGDKFLAIFYFNDALLVSQRYEQKELPGDCKNNVKKGTYKTPEAIKAIREG